MRVGTSKALADLGCLGGTLSTAKEFCLLALGRRGGQPRSEAQSLEEGEVHPEAQKFMQGCVPPRPS